MKIQTCLTWTIFPLLLVTLSYLPVPAQQSPSSKELERQIAEHLRRNQAEIQKLQQSQTPPAVAQENITSPKTPDLPQIEFESIDAWDLGVVKKTLVSTNGVSPVFSPNCDKLAYVEPSWNKGLKTIIIKSIPDLKTETVFKLNGGKNGIAWSPDGKRIISIDADYGKVTVLEVETGKQIELPDVHIGDYNVFWITNNVVGTYYGGGVNLDTLEKSGYSSEEIYEALNRSSHPKLNLGFSGRSPFQTEVFVTSKKRDYTKFLLDKDLSSAVTFGGGHAYHSWSSDSRYVARSEEVYSQEDREMHGRLYLLMLGKTSFASIDFVVEEFRGTDNPKAEFEKFLSNDQPITAELYAPKKNPLNGKIVGRIGDKKADGEIKIWDGQVIFCTTDQRLPINEGDVVCRVKWWSPNRGMGGEINENIWAVLGKAATNAVGATAPIENSRAGTEVPNVSVATEVKTLTATPQTPFEKITSSVQYANLFDDHTRQFAFSYDKVWSAVFGLITAQKEKSIQSDKVTGTILTDVTQHGVIGFLSPPSFDRYCLLVEKENENSTKVTLKLLKFFMDYEGKYGPRKTLQPENKGFVNKKADAFLDELDKQLQSGK